jgi:hypothetical protein
MARKAALIMLMLVLMLVFVLVLQTRWEGADE